MGDGNVYDTLSASQDNVLYKMITKRCNKRVNIKQKLL